MEGKGASGAAQTAGHLSAVKTVRGGTVHDSLNLQINAFTGNARGLKMLSCGTTLAFGLRVTGFCILITPAVLAPERIDHESDAGNDGRNAKYLTHVQQHFFLKG